MAHWSDNHASPPMDIADIKRVAASAERSRRLPIGCSHPLAPGFEPVEILSFEEAKRERDRENLAAAPQDDDGPISYRDLLKRIVPPVQEIVPGWIEKGIVTFLSGPGGVHKSRIAQQLGLSIDAGVPVFGRTVERATFVYISCEDNFDEVTRRAQTITRRLELPDEITGQFWDRRGKDAALAIVQESGECIIQPFWKRLRDFLLSIPGHKFVVCDGTYNVLRFMGQAKVNETSVMFAVGILQRLCDETDSTMLSLWHPSQAGQDRGDSSGWSVAWHNAPRARLSLTRVEKNFQLKVEKRNNGPDGETLALCWSDGVLLPRSQTRVVEQETQLQDAVVRAAISAAQMGTPNTHQKSLPKWQIDRIEQETQVRLRQKEAKEILATACSQGLLQYLRSTRHQCAGYYPPGEIQGIELARQAKRLGRAEPETGVAQGAKPGAKAA